MLTLIVNGEVYAPEPMGRCDVLLMGGRVARLGAVDRAAFERLGLEIDIIDAGGCLVVPGLIDSHEHLLGGSGESGFSSQTPEIHLGEIVSAGITTVVGALGVDTTMKTMPGLLARAKALDEEGLSAFIWTGGYNVPPTTITASVRDDILFIREVIGAGEIAIADKRSTDPEAGELARLVNDAYVGGMLSRKAGVTHFHVGERDVRLKLLRQLISDYGTPPETLYPTYVGRSEALLLEAIDLCRRGAFVDLDTVEEDLPERLRFYLDNGGDPRQLTVSSDASITGPGNVFAQLRACVLEHGFPPEEVLPLATANTARALKLRGKGKLEAGGDADLLVLRAADWSLREVVARGRHLMKDGRPAVTERFLEESNRSITLRGQRS